MALKKKITKAEFEKLNDILKAEYGESDDGYELDVTGIEDNAALLRAKNREKEAKQKAIAKIEELEVELEGFKSDPASKKLTVLEETLKKKYDTDIASKDGEITKLSAFAKKNLADNIASGLANEISTVPDLMLDVISKRIVADLTGDTPTTKILDKEGKVSALTLEDLKTELLADSRYSAIIVGSKAKGGASGKPALPLPGASGKGTQNTDVDLTKAKPDVLVSRIEARKAARNKG